MALTAAAAILSDPKVTEAANRTARSAAERTAAASGVCDPGLRHGTAGVALAFGQLAEATGDLAVAAAAGGWRSRLRLAVSDPSAVDIGFLEGSAGILLALLESHHTHHGASCSCWALPVAWRPDPGAASDGKHYRASGSAELWLATSRA